MMQAVSLARWACGGFFLTALFTGVWKYVHITKSDEHKAPVYVDIAHRAAFLYSFACLVLVHFAQISKWSAAVNFWGVAVAVFFFATAEGTYIIHGILRDTDNQLASPHKLGRSTLPGLLVHGYMIMLIAGEVGGLSRGLHRGNVLTVASVVCRLRGLLAKCMIDGAPIGLACVQSVRHFRKLLVISDSSLSFPTVPCHSRQFLVIPASSLSFPQAPCHFRQLLVIPFSPLSFPSAPCHSRYPLVIPFTPLSFP